MLPLISFYLFNAPLTSPAFFSRYSSRAWYVNDMVIKPSSKFFPIQSSSYRIIDAKYYPPSGESKNVTIMILGGSEGGMPSYNTKHFTEKGYPCIRIGYFRTENTPDRLEMIPLEYLEDAIKAFKSQPEVGDKKIFLLQGIGPQGGQANKIRYVKNPLISLGRTIIYSKDPRNEIKKYNQIFKKYVNK